MQYALKDLVRARKFRKDDATENVLKAKHHLELAQQELQKEQSILEAFLKQKPVEVQSIYNKVILKQVKKGAVDDIYFELAQLDAKQIELEHHVEIAQTKVDDAEDNLFKTKQQLRQAEKELEKIEEHKKIWLEEVKKLEEASADKEMEDFRTKPRESF